MHLILETLRYFGWAQLIGCSQVMPGCPTSRIYPRAIVTIYGRCAPRSLRPTLHRSHPPCHSAPHARSIRPKANTTAPHMNTLHSHCGIRIAWKYHNHLVSYVYLFVYSHYFYIQTAFYAIRFIKIPSLQLFVSHIMVNSENYQLNIRYKDIYADKRSPGFTIIIMVPPLKFGNW